MGDHHRLLGQFSRPSFHVYPFPSRLSVCLAAHGPVLRCKTSCGTLSRSTVGLCVVTTHYLYLIATTTVHFGWFDRSLNPSNILWYCRSPAFVGIPWHGANAGAAVRQQRQWEDPLHAESGRESRHTLSTPVDRRPTPDIFPRSAIPHVPGTCGQ